MGTTVEKLNKLKTTKEAIRTAINNKGGTLTTSDKFSDYSAAINRIQVSEDINPLQYLIDNWEGDGQPGCYQLFYYYSGSSLDSVLNKIDTSKLTSMRSMFNYCFNLKTIPQFNTSSCTNMNDMFKACSNLTSIAQLDTSKVTNMSNMFNQCKKLTTIPQLDTSSCTNMYRMFCECSSLNTIPQLDTSKVTSAVQMFSECSSLASIPQLDLTKATSTSFMFQKCYQLRTIQQLNTSDITNMSSMFTDCRRLTTIDLTYIASTSENNNQFAYNCFSLKKLIIRNMDTIPALNSNAFTNCLHFYGTADPGYNPNGLKDGRIYVPDNKVEELKTATNWSVFADIIVPLSTLIEE